ncbi:MAG TPA: hypothetical protein VJI32_03495 [Candidatus Nanoarchaeia archaeon]|nr:hypothetical protein [Candidatus Nanoarchaeia archaeon]
MALSHTKPPIEPPAKEFEPAVALGHETLDECLDECLDEMDLCDHAVDIVTPAETYTAPVSLVYMVAECYSSVRDTSVALAARVSEIVVEGYDFELLKSFFKKLEPRKDFLQKAPEGGDESGKIAYAFLQKMKHYFSHEVAEIFHWNGYELQRQRSQ